MPLADEERKEPSLVVPLEKLAPLEKPTDAPILPEQPILKPIDEQPILKKVDEEKKEEPLLKKEEEEKKIELPKEEKKVELEAPKVEEKKAEEPKIVVEEKKIEELPKSAMIPEKQQDVSSRQ